MKRIKKMILPFVFALMSAAITVSAASATDMQNYNGHSYKVFHENKTWSEAKAACEKMGGHLVTITSKKENEFVNSLKGLSRRTNYWLGGQEVSGKWTWITGEKWSFTNWGSNQPDNSQQDTGVKEDYLQVCYDWGLKWNDSAIKQDRTAGIGYICEWDNKLSTNKEINKEITSAKDKDLSNSRYEFLQAKVTTTTKNSLTLTWKKISSADGYMIYGNKCGTKNKYKYICTLANRSTTKYVAKNLKKGTYYKYFVVAYKKVGNEKVTVTISKTIHATTSGGKYGNAKSVKITKLGKSTKQTDKITLSVGKTAQITGKSIKKDKKISNHRGLAYESTNSKVAAVNKSGKITAKKKGSCKIYVYAQNGVCKTITVTVK